MQEETKEENSAATQISENNELPEKSEKKVSDKNKQQKKKLHGRPPKKPLSKNKKTTGQLLIGFLVKIAVIAAATAAVLLFVLGVNVHYGNNMHPSVSDGDLVVSFRMQRPFLNAVVLYDCDGKTNVGRVVAMEGSVVAITDAGELTVNGIVPSEEVFYPTFKSENSEIQFPYTVEKGKVFILNDFRLDTYDSRSFGAVDIKDLKGPALFTMRRRGF